MNEPVLNPQNSRPPSSYTHTAAYTHTTPKTPPPHELTVALAGNPNVGKTTLFNALTGLKQKVANYPGVTVEKKIGRCLLGETSECQIIDLPGTYSLASRSPDEHVARSVMLGQIAGTPRPDVIVVLADATNLERNLYLVTQVLELGRPAIVALSMMDLAEAQGKRIDVEKLSRHLRVPVVPVQAHKNKEGRGIQELKSEIAKAAKHVHTATTGATAGLTALTLPLPEVMETHIERLKKILATEGLCSPEQAYFDAHLMLSTSDEDTGATGGDDLPDARRQHPQIRAELTAAIAACAAADIDPVGSEVEAHYAFISSIIHDCLREEVAADKISRTDRIDRLVTHRIWGMLIFIALMAGIFITIFWLADPIMKFINDSGGLIDHLKGWVGGAMADGPLKNLINEGIIGGVGNVVVFLPQIAILFFFVAVLEDSGYMARAAFLMDRLMSKVGLHGKSFIPLLSAYACAVPAIMGTRVIENRRDRLATILVLPLMSCSARLPIYLLVIAAFWGAYGALTRAGVMLAMYALGTLSAFGLAWLFKRTLLKGPAPAFIMEMPPYRLPHAKVVLLTVAQRCGAFLKRAGTVIFAFSVIMWAATHYPKPVVFSQNYDQQIAQLETQIATLQASSAAQAQIDEENSKIGDFQNARDQEILENSIAGRVGRMIAPVFYPLGYDWKLSIGVTGAFFAREVIVSTMGVVYSVGEADEQSVALQSRLRQNYSPLVGVSLMVFVVFCMQCLSTLAITRKETGNWGWPAFMFFYMTGLAWVAAFVTYQGGRLLGLG